MKNQNQYILLFIIVIQSVFSFHGLAQLTNISWQLNIGGSQDDMISDFHQTSDQGYIFGGHTQSKDYDMAASKGGVDIVIIKTNHNGKIEWKKMFGGVGDERLNDILLIPGGGFLLTGSTNSKKTGNIKDQTDSDAWIVKLNSKGKIEWQLAYGDIRDNQALSACFNQDNKFVILNKTTVPGAETRPYLGNVSLTVVSLDGKIISENVLSGEEETVPVSIQRYGNGYLVAGIIYLPGADIYTANCNFRILKCNEKGTIEWKKSYGGTDTDMLNSCIQTTGGNLMLVGYTHSNDGNIGGGNHDTTDASFNTSDGWIVTLDSLGNLLSQKTYGYYYYDEFGSIAKTADGGYILSGTSDHYQTANGAGSGNQNIWILKIDDKGNKQWEKFIGGSKTEISLGCIETKEGNFIFCGSSRSADRDVRSNKGRYDFWLGSILKP